MGGIFNCFGNNLYQNMGLNQNQLSLGGLDPLTGLYSNALRNNTANLGTAALNSMINYNPAIAANNATNLNAVAAASLTNNVVNTANTAVNAANLAGSSSAGTCSTN